MKASSPDFTSVHVVCQKRDVTTKTSRWSPTAFIRSGRAEQLRGLHGDAPDRPGRADDADVHSVCHVPVPHFSSSAVAPWLA